ncbi:MAG: hypothetical protein IKO83_01405 [Oscillospiraceae bacterium]|nr:hypothetical protein [Oscillospiraceae bacterium]MBR7190514.1 hypothetical protein [Oscillospiraceae bacterium]
MNQTLKSFTDLLLFRVLNDGDLRSEELAELLEQWYQLRQRVEEPGNVTLTINPPKAPAGQKKTPKK